MNYCKNCGKKLRENEKFCTECGAQISNSMNDKISNNNSNNLYKYRKTKVCKYCRTEIDEKAKVCPQCHSKLKSHDFLKALIVGICFVAFITYFYAKYQFEYNEYGEDATDEYINNYREKEKEKNSVRFTMTEDHISPESNEYFTYIEGKIKNNSIHSVSYISVTFNIYDSAGNTIGSCLDNNSGLDGKGTWTFKAICTEGVNKIARYELKEITSL